MDTPALLGLLAALFLLFVPRYALAGANAPGGAKPASAATKTANERVRALLDFGDALDFEEATRGFIAPLPGGGVIKNAAGEAVWDMAQYAFIEQSETAPQTVNPSLWRQSRLTMKGGLFRVVDRLYQVRNADISNLTIIEGDTGRQSWSMTVAPGGSGVIEPDAAAADIARALSGEFLRLRRASAQDGAARGDRWSALEAGRHTLLQSSDSAIVAAKAEAQRALALAPENPHAHVLLASAIAEEIVNGYAADIAASRTEALREVEQALMLASDDPVVLKYAGHVLAICGQHEQGERVLRRALALNLYDEGAHGYLGWVLAPSTAPAHLDEIKAVLDRLLRDARQHPGRPFWFLHRSVALSCRGDFEGALAAAREAVDFSPNLTPAWLQAVNALGQLGRLDEARTLVSRCPLNIERRSVSWEELIRQVSRDEAAAELRTAGLRRLGLV